MIYYDMCSLFLTCYGEGRVSAADTACWILRYAPVDSSVVFLLAVHYSQEKE